MFSFISLMNYWKPCHVVVSIFEGLSDKNETSSFNSAICRGAKAVHEKKPSYFDIEKNKPIEASQSVGGKIFS